MSDHPALASEIPSNEHLSLRVMPLPADVNPSGDVFGGWIMAMVDVAGAIPAIRRASSRVVTVAVNSFVFKQPVSVGDVVSFYAEVSSVGRSSITVDVHVFAERNPADPIVVKVTEARLTYVAVDRDGNKRVVGDEGASAAVAGCAEPPSDKELVLRVVPFPADLNPAGDVFGGWIMSMVDIAGAVPAIRQARSKVATVAVDSFVFRQPVSVGDVVSFYAEIVHVGNTSVTVDVEVFARRNPENPVVVKVTEAKLTYVAIDELRAKHPIGAE
ncbi:MAG: acyl-CoA thioesterase [Betaproteobacteria bacterium]|nr:MAG: acyl-CoA thioesterase [Betaproteobacteria bacterium]